MHMGFYEKFIILCVIFIGVTIGTASIIGNYVAIKKNNAKQPETRLILGFK